MFDIGFWEIAIICVVALLVVGPERLPGLARDLARWTRAIRRFISNARREIEHELSELDRDLNRPMADEFHDNLSTLDDLLKDAPDRRPAPGPRARADEDPATAGEPREKQAG